MLSGRHRGAHKGPVPILPLPLDLSPNRRFCAFPRRGRVQLRALKASVLVKGRGMGLGQRLAHWSFPRPVVKCVWLLDG